MRAEVRALVALGLAAVIALSGCTADDPTPPTPTPSTGFPKDAFTVMTTDKVTQVDPAGVTDASSMLLSANVFQTLMTSDPGADVLKPDLAQDCGFIDSPRIYTCTLREGVTFHNGDPLTSADVKFSVQRATRLDVAGSSAALLSSLRRIDTPDDRTVEFVLSRTDTQFGSALASPAAAIVDRRAYDPDSLQPASDGIVGSGPFRVVRRTATELDLAKFDGYVGRTPARYPYIAVKSVADSATIEDAMSQQQVDVVWRGLSSAALARFAQQIGTGDTTADGYVRRLLPGARVRQLIWSPDSAHRDDKAVRQAIAVALQDDRTLDSVVPVNVVGHVSSFPTGGQAKPKVTWDNRISLSLGYDSTVPDGRDLANQIRSRLEDTGGLSVRVVPDNDDVDLRVVDRKAWTPTAYAWLQPVLEDPLPASRSALEKTATTFVSSETISAQGAAAAQTLIAQLQTKAATDAVVLPLTQADEVLFSRAGVTVGETSFAPGWQLGLWGLTRE